MEREPAVDALLQSYRASKAANRWALASGEPSYPSVPLSLVLRADGLSLCLHPSPHDHYQSVAGVDSMGALANKQAADERLHRESQARAREEAQVEEPDWLSEAAATLQVPEGQGVKNENNAVQRPDGVDEGPLRNAERRASVAEVALAAARRQCDDLNATNRTLREELARLQALPTAAPGRREPSTGLGRTGAIFIGIWWGKEVLALAVSVASSMALLG
jgi:hypothetical protein